jgi:GH24 family phage-related lysozyme (muramidase)
MSLSTAIQLAIDALIRPFEGYARRLPDGGCAAYPDPATKADPWTIGYGSTGPDISPDTRWTHEQALSALRTHATQFAMGVLSLSPTLATEPDRRIAALISFAYNCGLGNYRISTLRRRVNQRDWLEAAREIMKWNKAAGRVMSGLTRRRAAEAALLN